MANERRVSTVRMGPISVFALVIILCLAVLGVLSASTATAGSSLAQRQASFAADDYCNEVAGQQLYAAADDALAPVRAAGGDAAAATAAPTSLGCASPRSKFSRRNTPAALPSERPTELASRLCVSRVRT